MVIVIGSINIDLCARVATLPRAGETVLGQSFFAVPGGKGANQALAAARAGSAVRLVGAVGADSFAEPAVANLKEAGVDLAGVKTCEAATGTALILISETGENIITVVAGANGLVDGEAVAEAGLSAGDVLLLQGEIPVAAVAAALSAARAAGAISVLNLAPYAPALAALAAEADVVVVNGHEFNDLCALHAIGPAEETHRILALAEVIGGAVVLTRGAEGALAVFDGAAPIAMPALAIDAVDTVGAGDTFCGYFGAGLAEGLGPEEALARASIAASLACTAEGAQAAIPAAAAVTAAASAGMAANDAWAAARV